MTGAELAHESLHAGLEVGELAARVPAAVKVFQRHRLDFCCGGRRPLAEVCQERGLDAEALLAEIRALTARDATAAGDATTRRWDEAPLGELVDHILEVYHRSLEEDLPRLEAMARRVLVRHGARDPERFERLATLVIQLRAELEQHTRKEEQVLFPWIVSGRGAAAGAPIRAMFAEHDDAAEILRALREVTGDYVVPEGACATWQGLWKGLEALERDLHVHIHLENNVLFPRALAG